jgi:hypothetical protein
MDSNSSCIGNPCTGYKNSKYPQGGCYFMNNKLVSKMVNTPITNIIKKYSKKIRMPFGFCPEDGTIFNIIKKNSKKIKFIQYYVTANKLDNLKKEREKMSVIHCSSYNAIDKEDIPKIYNKIKKLDSI